jgi:endonuclease YncB( thermonuclease family)
MQRSLMHACLLSTLALVLIPVHAAEFAARVERFLDGDSLWIKPLQGSQAPLEVRLRDIDAPESCQAWGPQARAALIEALNGKTFTVRTYAQDSHGRTLVRIDLDGADLGRWLVSEGHAWSTRSRWDRGPLVREERVAASLRRGLHAAGGAVHPAQFRRSHGPCIRQPRRARR